MVWRLRKSVIGLLALSGLALGLGAVFSAQMGTTAALSTLAGRKVIIDPGHGGKDPGAVGYGGREDHVVLAICRDLKQDLTRSGLTVILTRNSHVDLLNGQGGTKKLELAKRIEMVNASGADAFLSIHANAGTSSAWRGAQVFVDQKASPASKTLGQKIQEALQREVGTTRKLNQGINHYLLKNSTIPAATVEVGFMTNPQESRLLQSAAYQRRLALAITHGVLDYFGTPVAGRRGGG